MQFGNHVGIHLSVFAGLVLAAAATAAPSAGAIVRDSARQSVGVVYAQVIIQRSTIIRVPPATPLALPILPMQWKEKSAPNCVKLSNLAAGMVSSPTTIDLIVRGGTRYRIKLEKSCQAIDFYQGFYVKPTADGQICKSRDSIHSRSGGKCEIDKFKTLVPGK